MSDVVKTMLASLNKQKSELDTKLEEIAAKLLILESDKIMYDLQRQDLKALILYIETHRSDLSYYAQQIIKDKALASALEEKEKEKGASNA